MKAKQKKVNCVEITLVDGPKHIGKFVNIYRNGVSQKARLVGFDLEHRKMTYKIMSGKDRWTTQTARFDDSQKAFVYDSLKDMPKPKKA